MKRDELIDNLKEIIAIATKSIVEQKEISNNARDLYIASFTSSIIEYADSIVSLTAVNKLIAIPTILRSILEAYAELLNLCKYEDYTYVLNSNYIDLTNKKASNNF